MKRDWIEAYWKNPDTELLGQVSDKYEKRLKAMALRVTCGNHCDAEDALQDMYVELLEKPVEPRTGITSSGLFYTQIKWKAIDAWRARYRRSLKMKILPLEENIKNLTLPNKTQKSIEVEEIGRSLPWLPERQRLTIILRYSGMEFQEIAQLLNVDVRTILTYRNKVKECLRRWFSENADECFAKDFSDGVRIPPLPYSLSGKDMEHLLWLVRVLQGAKHALRNPPSDRPSVELAIIADYLPRDLYSKLWKAVAMNPQLMRVPIFNFLLSRLQTRPQDHFIHKLIEPILPNLTDCIENTGKNIDLRTDREFFATLRFGIAGVCCGIKHCPQYEDAISWALAHPRELLNKTIVDLVDYYGIPQEDINQIAFHLVEQRLPYLSSEDNRFLMAQKFAETELIWLRELRDLFPATRVFWDDHVEFLNA